MKGGSGDGGGERGGREGGAGEGGAGERRRPEQVEKDEDDKWQMVDPAANGRLAEHCSPVSLKPRRYFFFFFKV